MQKYNIKNIKKYMIGAMICAMPFAACEKDPVEPTPVNPTPVTPTTQKHNVELVFADIAQDLHMDTIYKYNSDPTVDTIFMIPDRYNKYSTLSTNGLKNVANKLRERHNVNPNKVFGKGELQLQNESIVNNPEIVRFFADTLKYNVTSR